MTAVLEIILALTRGLLGSMVGVLARFIAIGAVTGAVSVGGFSLIKSIKNRFKRRG